MALNKESNGYVILFSTILVLATSVALVTVFSFTKDTVSNNQKLEKMQNILQAARVNVDRDQAEPEYKKTVVDAFALTEKGEVKMKGEIENVFNIDLASELKKKEDEEKLFPVFVCNKNDSTLYILAMRGKGLWDAIWGYVALQSDMKTIYNVVFDHKGETPGLGAEIKEPWYTAQFPGKKIVNDQGEFVSVSVIKKGTAPESDYNVDGVSGGTLTSNGLHDMLRVFFSAFYEYSKNRPSTQTQAGQPQAEPETIAAPTDSLAADSLNITTGTADTITNNTTTTNH